MQSQLQSPKFQSPSCLPCASLQPCRLLQHQHFTANLSSAQPQQPQHTLTQQNTSLKMIITALSEPAELRLPSTAGKSRAARRAPGCQEGTAVSCGSVSQRLPLVPPPWGCAGEREELLVQGNAWQDATYKVTDIRMLHKFKELQKQ